MALALCISFVAHSEVIPDRANQYKRTLIRYAQAEFGIDAPVPMLAAQIHKESAWRKDVCSAYACGLTQFTDATAEDAGRKYPALGPADVFNPNWAIQAMVLYDSDLKQQVDAIDECNDYGFALAMYNGGPGWIWKEKNLQEKVGERDQYWEGVENVSARADWAKKENRDYPRKIIFNLQELYLSDGTWGSVEVCPNGPTVVAPEAAEDVVAPDIQAPQEETVPEEVPSQESVKPDNPKPKTWKDWFLGLFN